MSRLLLLSQYVCSPPEQPPNGIMDAPVVVRTLSLLQSFQNWCNYLYIIIIADGFCFLIKVFVGQNLRYEVGTVSYRTPGSPRSSGSGDNTVTVVAVVIVVCMLLLLIGLATVVGIFIVIKRRSWITGYAYT